MAKQWQKLISKHVESTLKATQFSFTSPPNSHLQFIHASYPLLKKHYSIPHTLRSKVWQYILIDNLAITNGLFVHLVSRRNKGEVDEQISGQIRKDIIRSFNGEGSKDKLKRVFEMRNGMGMGRKTVSEIEKHYQQQGEVELVRNNSMETTDTVIFAE